MSDKTEIWVYAHWLDMLEPTLVGMLSAQQAKGKKAFSFRYDEQWLAIGNVIMLDPDLQWFGGAQYPLHGKDNFGVFTDSMPDTWGRTLMKRRAVLQNKDAAQKKPALHDLDFLLGVHDANRMGALRFKTEPNGPFQDDDDATPAPPWASLRELQHVATMLETDNDAPEVREWIAMLMAPGSSLGGARPKANILDDAKHPWIAKFPSNNDTVDKAAWEFLAYKLATKAGIDMAPSKLLHIHGKHHTFLTQRFDRQEQTRIHFASAMTMLGKTEALVRDNTPSYLEMVEFIQFHGANVVADLKQLWRRIVFNILISNTDDHLRNHGFVLREGGWHLSPAYDLNPSVDKEGLSLNVDAESNALDIDLANSVGPYFQLSKMDMNNIVEEVREAVSTWRTEANEIGITRGDQQLMQGAFRV